MTKSKSPHFCAIRSIRQAARAIAVLGVLATISILPVNAATLHVTDDAFIDLSKPHYRHGNSSKIIVGVNAVRVMDLLSSIYPHFRTALVQPPLPRRH